MGTSSVGGLLGSGRGRGRGGGGSVAVASLGLEQS